MKKIDPDRLLEVVFILVLLLASTVTLTAGILMLTLLSPIVTIQFWSVVVYTVSILFIVSGVTSMLFEMLLLIFCIKDKELYISHED